MSQVTRVVKGVAFTASDEPWPFPSLTPQRCRCAAPDFLCYPEDGECACGIHPHHVHCICGGVPHPPER